MNRANKTCNTKENVKRSTCKACISREKKAVYPMNKDPNYKNVKRKKTKPISIKISLHRILRFVIENGRVARKNGRYPWNWNT